MNPFASFYAAGVPVCFGSDSPVTPLRPWASVRACLQHNNPAEQISARAAFLGHTRAGWRAARYRNPMAGQLVPGAPASFAVWEVEELMVQVADGRVQSWSTDPRAPDAAAAGAGYRHRTRLPPDRAGRPGTVLRRLAPELTPGPGPMGRHRNLSRHNAPLTCGDG